MNGYSGKGGVMNIPYSEAFDRLKARFPNFTLGEFVMWVRLDELNAYCNRHGAASNIERIE